MFGALSAYRLAYVNEIFWKCVNKIDFFFKVKSIFILSILYTVNSWFTQKHHLKLLKLPSNKQYTLLLHVSKVDPLKYPVESCC